MIVAALVAVTLMQKDKQVEENPVFPKLYHKPTKGATLSEFTLRFPVKAIKEGQSGTITFPAPSNYSGQVIISLDVKSDPPTALKSWHWEDRPDGLNSVIVARVAPAGKGAWLSYKAQVMLPPEPVYRTMSKIHDPWLASTACVQSNDPDIIALSKKLSEGVMDRTDYVANATMWVALNNGQKGEAFSSLDAKRGLKCGGSCTNRANLCAALLRAKGIPARTISHMPTWVNGKFYEHWLTEYWTDDGNWAMVEPTLGVKHPARNTVVVLSISSPEDEAKAFDPQHIKSSMPGSPYLSLAELSKELIGAELPGADDDAINDIHLIKTFPGQAVSRVMTSGYRRSLKVIEEAKKGVNSALDFESELKSIAKSPVDFAMLLDGRHP